MGRVCGARIWLIVGLLAFGAAATAQTGAGQRPAGPPEADPVRLAFEALPDGERRALQDALVWTGDYKGAPDGAYGRGAREALNGWAARMKLAPERTLDEAARAALLRSAERARTAAGFARTFDPRSGAAIALPKKALPRQAESPTGSRWSNTDGSAQVETFRMAGDGGLPLLFERLRAEASDRRVTYRVLRPDFLVVAGEDPRGLFYTRAARAENGALRGYTLTYARRLAPAFEIYAVAISNGFEANQPQGPSAQPAVQATAPATPAPQLRLLQVRVLQATAVMVGPNLLASVLASSCTQPRLGERAARIVQRDRDTGLALLDVAGLAAPALSPGPPAAVGAPVVTLFAARQGDGATAISAAAGEMLGPTSPGGPMRISAALQDGIGGAAVFDRSGAWSGLVLPATAEPRRMAGVTPAAAYGVAPSEALAALLRSGGVSAAIAPDRPKSPLSAGEIASKAAASVFGVTCNE